MSWHDTNRIHMKDLDPLLEFFKKETDTMKNFPTLPSRRTVLRPLAGIVMAALLGAATLPLTALAQDKPALKMIVGFPPGGSVDVLARNVAEAMRDDFSSVVVENRPGAAGRIALGQIKNTKPDGLTVIVAPSPGFVLFPHIFKKLDYDPNRDFTPISHLASQPFGITAGLNANVKTIAEMSDKAKKDPNSATIGSSGEGSAGHVLGVWLGQLLNASFTHVPFQGGGPANIAMLGGTVSYRIDALSETTEFHKTGKARLLAVTGAKRDPQVPDVPTLKELGVNMDASSWFGMFGPAGMPKEALDRISQSVMKAVKRPDLSDRLLKMGFEPNGSTPAELGARLRTDFSAWEKPAKGTGLSLE